MDKLGASHLYPSPWQKRTIMPDLVTSKLWLESVAQDECKSYYIRVGQKIMAITIIQTQEVMYNTCKYLTKIFAWKYLANKQCKDSDLYVIMPACRQLGTRLDNWFLIFSFTMHGMAHSSIWALLALKLLCRNTVCAKRIKSY